MKLAPSELTARANMGRPTQLVVDENAAVEKHR